jgi:outer membrane protein TolC
MLSAPILAKTLPSHPLSVMDAVLLAVRFHPSVKHAQLQRVLERFAVSVAENTFMPQYFLSGTSTWAQGVDPQHSASASIGLKSSWGGQVTLRKSGPHAGDNATAIEVSQPLLRGFGSGVNRSELDNARDQEVIGYLDLRSTLTQVINRALTAYWALLQADQDLKVHQLSLNQTRTVLKSYQIKVKIGQMARVNLLQQETALLQGQLAYQTQVNQIKTVQQNLRMALGLDPDASLQIDHHLDLLTRIKLPTLKRSIDLALKYNVGYLKEKLSMHAVERGVVVAEDAQRWQLDAEGQWSRRDWQAGLKLSVPVHDLARQQQLLSARIAYRQAASDLTQAKQTLISDVKTSWLNCRSELQQIQLAQKAVTLSYKDYQLAQRARLAGINSTYEVIAQQKNWVDAQLQLSALKITYLNSLIAFHAQLGTTLSIWGIHLGDFLGAHV